ncbi:MAG TPA: 2,3-bisphosphoglycerate-independent phosphoglycerate mutase [Candidatus Eisenbacteria bacterium]|jgi:2,3-bisphosphoglycerate-independent phosphoglycerate mutase
MAARSPLVGLVILDGWALNPRPEGNAVLMARTPVFDRLMRECPHTTLLTFGEHVGLPTGQMGNSEVGHLNLGAGRIVYQDLTRIDRAVEDGSLARSPVLAEAFRRARAGGTLHFLGLHSTGGVHSHLRHLHALLRSAVEAGVERIRIHAILDGRDTPPRSARTGLEETEALCGALGRGAMATVGGRYFAMDRDGRWPRVEKGYRAMVSGEGRRAKGAVAALEEAYARDESDEFVAPTVLEAGGEGSGRIRRGDTVIAFNFRPDRMRQITRALNDEGFDGFPRPEWPLDLHYVCMTRYHASFPYPVLFTDEPLGRTLGELVSEAGIRQLRISETEKYAHVTYFFNGGEESPRPGEDRVLIPSPQVATYDLKPEMSAFEVTAEVERRLAGPQYGFFVLNFANPDMVGHTGVLSAGIRAVEVVDECLSRVLEGTARRGGVALVTADHGNADQMIDYATGGPHTAHTTHPVPAILVGTGPVPLRNGILADVAPTLLGFLGLAQPEEMTGRALLGS